jgi:hypothetical protein
MAYDIPGFQLGTKVASVDLSSAQFLAVVVNSSGKIALAGAGVAIAGILNNTPGADQACKVIVSGVSKTRVGAAVAEGDKLTPNGSGQLITATEGDAVVGTALGAASNANDIIPVLLQPQGLIPDVV